MPEMEVGDWRSLLELIAIKQGTVHNHTAQNLWKFAKNSGVWLVNGCRAGAL